MRTLPEGIMCLTLDTDRLDHVSQAEQLARAGARIIQLRTKSTPVEKLEDLAAAFVRSCHAHGALAIINDHPEIAKRSGADGVHLGKTDPDWQEVRRYLGGEAIIGGTVNNAADAERAKALACLNYVGVGPLRFTPTKQKLAPVLGMQGLGALLRTLAGLPAYAIGGVLPEDLRELKRLGAHGVAVCAPLYGANTSISKNYHRYSNEWHS